LGLKRLVVVVVGSSGVHKGRIGCFETRFWMARIPYQGHFFL